jgi:hypothetical protein
MKTNSKPGKFFAGMLTKLYLKRPCRLVGERQILQKIRGKIVKNEKKNPQLH